ncbi:unnamed protein product [Acanthosepion pharaonis]|uniref:Uncharacterized protein n=1 Tax=Acanthosepion pharaonis TaxID=158019 RepID=A0A812CAY8_ACAPH|nr:unnamed protein product [Sepia pharaonis]
MYKYFFIRSLFQFSIIDKICFFKLFHFLQFHPLLFWRPFLSFSPYNLVFTDFVIFFFSSHYNFFIYIAFLKHLSFLIFTYSTLLKFFFSRSGFTYNLFIDKSFLNVCPSFFFSFFLFFLSFLTLNLFLSPLPFSLLLFSLTSSFFHLFVL